MGEKLFLSLTSETRKTRNIQAVSSVYEMKLKTALSQKIQQKVPIHCGRGWSVFYPFVSDRFEEATHIVGRNALHNDGQKGFKSFLFWSVFIWMVGLTV